MKLKYIDALRGFAIVGVLVVHCGQYGTNDQLPSLIQTIVLHGAHGVQLFYVVSAFTLFLTLDKQSRSENYTWTGFYLRRVFRIAPMYYLGICYFLWQDGFGPRYFLGDAPAVTPANIFANIFFIHGFNPYWITSVVPGGWSIAVEMTFYCLIPFLFVGIKNTRQACAFFLITLGLRAVLQFVLNRVSIIGSERLWQEYLNFYLPSQLPVFALGILLYFIIKEKYRLSLPPLLIIILSVVFIADFAGIPILPDHVLFSIGFLGLAIALSKHEFPAFVNPVTVYIGRVSYSMYLVHFAVLFGLNAFKAVDYIQVFTPLDAVLNFVIRLVIVLMLSVGMASLFYYLVELPCQRIGKRLIEKVNRKVHDLVPAVEVGSQVPLVTSTLLREQIITENPGNAAADIKDEE